MKLICLNLWLGNRQQLTLQFIKEQSRDTDIFCFQEVVSGGRKSPTLDKRVYPGSFEEITAALPEYNAYFTAAPSTTEFVRHLSEHGAQAGQAIFIRKEMRVIDQAGLVLYSENPFAGQRIGGITGNFDFVTFENDTQTYTIGNVHGLWQEHKDDTPERLEQSRRLLEFFSARPGKKVLCGDFNMRPEAKSIEMLSSEMKNLIEEYKVTNTRNAEYHDMEKYKDYIADYAFVSRDVAVEDFRVLPDVVSDHAPLMLMFK